MIGKWKNLTKKQIFQIAVFLALLLLAMASFGFQERLAGSLLSQRGADRWMAGEERFAQVSVFLGADEAYDKNSINGIRSQVARKLEEASVSLPKDSKNARLWIDGYCGQGSLNVSRGNVNQMAEAIGVGGDFFYFHPLELLDGYYFASDELMKDRVLIDHELAWKLYGSSDVEGMDILIGGKRCIVAGVFSREEGRAFKAAYGETSKVFMPLELLEEVTGEAKISSYEMILPNPVSDFAYGILKSIATGVDSAANDEEKEETRNIVVLENSSRFDKIKLLKLITQFGERSMKKTNIKYPYWENQARAIEEYAALFLYLAALLLLVPVMKTSVFLFRKWKNRKYRFAYLKELLEQKIEDYRVRQKKERKSEYEE